MALKKEVLQQLDDIISLLQEIDPEFYQQKLDIFNGSTIGQHVRHILEFYLCIENGIHEGIICYDDRKRDPRIENDMLYTLEIIADIKFKLEDQKEDTSLELKANYSTDNICHNILQTSSGRELAYAFDHGVHHLAMVRIALKQEGIKVTEHLGVAPSTINYRKSCAQ